jgi:hypothetical protein
VPLFLDCARGVIGSGVDQGGQGARPSGAGSISTAADDKRDPDPVVGGQFTLAAARRLAGVLSGFARTNNSDEWL